MSDLQPASFEVDLNPVSPAIVTGIIIMAGRAALITAPFWGWVFL